MRVGGEEAERDVHTRLKRQHSVGKGEDEDE